MQENQKKKPKSFRLSTLLLVLGFILVVTGVVYEAINYPWGYKNATKDTSSMSEPKPLPNITAPETPPLPEANLDEIPASDLYTPLKRPEIPLVKLGIIKIPRISLSENILAGADLEILYGVGHVTGSALPNENGNFVVSGHRNYIWMHPFKHLDKLQTDDIVEVTTDEDGTTKTYQYKIYKTVTVLPEDVWVMQPQPEADRVITLITCTPVPSYSHRLVYFGELIEEA